MSEKDFNKGNKSKKKPYKKPTIISEKILEAGLGATCNGTTNGGRKAATPACKATSLKT